MFKCVSSLTHNAFLFQVRDITHLVEQSSEYNDDLCITTNQNMSVNSTNLTYLSYMFNLPMKQYCLLRLIQSKSYLSYLFHIQLTRKIID